MFPSDVTTVTSMNANDTLKVAGHSTRHNAEIKPIVEALEAKVGVNGSAVTTSHDYKLSGVTGTDKSVSKTGTETLTNKTLTSPTSTGTDTGTQTLSNKTLTAPVINNPTGAIAGILPNGYAEITTDFSSATVGSDVDITGLTATVTFPSGGRRAKITVFIPGVYETGSGAHNTILSIKDSVAGTIFTSQIDNLGSSSVFQMIAVAIVTPTAASHTYKASIKQVGGAGNVVVQSTATQRPFILVEQI